MRILILIAVTILAVGCTKDDRPICPSCGERATMQMHPRMSGTGIELYYKCDNKHNFTKDGELVDVFGNPLKKKPVVKKDKTEGNLSYSIKEEAITITKCNSSASGELSIPATIEGKSVTSIGSSAFSSCNKLTSITIPDSVTSIGSQAFQGCYNLTSITIGDGVTSIGDRAFEYCRSLTSITIPDGVTSIGEGTFFECRSLTSITIPDGVTSIGEEAFRNCSALTSITIPKSVTSIGYGAFMGCNSLTTIEVGVGNVNYTDVNGVLFNTEKTVLHTYPKGKTGDNYNIPDSVISIGDKAFSLCTRLTSITIPDSVTSIGNVAFLFCKSLTSITIPDSVTSIGNQAFSDCEGLTTVTFLGDAPKAGEQVFEFTISTIYRNPEAKGWGDTWGGRPVKLISEKP